MERWQHGCRNAIQLWREISDHGYPGSYRQVARLLGELRRQERRGGPLPHAPPGLTPAQAVGILVRHPADRTEAERRAGDCLPAMHAEVRQAVIRFEAFAQLLRGRGQEHVSQRLERWMATAEASEIPELTAFVVNLRQDRAAVSAALVLPYSQGQAEGQINRMNLLKCAMYGRATFDLLRHRVLYAVG